MDNIGNMTLWNHCVTFETPCIRELGSNNKGQLKARTQYAPPDSKPDIILIVETDYSCHISLNGYSLMRRDSRICLIYHKMVSQLSRKITLSPIQTSSGIDFCLLAIDWYNKHLDHPISKTKATYVFCPDILTSTIANGCPASPPLILKLGQPTISSLFMLLMISHKL